MSGVRGYIDEFGQPFVPITLGGIRRQFDLDAIVDTGLMAMYACHWA